MRAVRRKWGAPPLSCTPALFCAALFLSSHAARADFVQQGAKLVGTGADGAALQGMSVALSADGSTVIVGGYADNSLTGAAWVYTRSGGAWTQQGGKLVGTGAFEAASQGFSVALSADGNTALVGGYSDDDYAGAAWAFTRSGGVWAQQGDKLWGSGVIRARTQQGISVALSADGNTALVGGHGAQRFVGGAWAFTRGGGIWSQQGSRLVGTGAVGWAHQGWSVALSADGNTAIIGGYADDDGAGAAWVFTRSTGVWTRQGSKLVGTGARGVANQGYSVALSADGNTAMVGGYSDDNNAGAAWVFTRAGDVWTQQGSKLVGGGAVGAARQGQSVALSADGNTAMVGGYADNNLDGAAWVFIRNGGIWSQLGSKLIGSEAIGEARQGRAVGLSADGSTAIIGGFGDNGNAGAVWIFLRRPHQ
jgi:hypothetical protein